MGVAMSEFKIFLGPIEGFPFFYLRDIRIVQSKTFYLSPNISSIAFIEV
jgi:hypothetical protein